MGLVFNPLPKRKVVSRQRRVVALTAQSIYLLSIHADVTFDETTENLETHIRLPYGSSNYGNPDEIHIAIMNQDLAVLPSASSLRVVGRLTKRQWH